MTDDATDRERQQEAIHEDPDLLNAEFYRSDPAAHFEQRLARLLHDPGTEDLDNKLLADVARRLGRPLEQLPPRVAESPWFLAVELELLLHHLSETLLRLYLGHRDRPACPWLAISSLRTPRQFKDLVSQVSTQSEGDLASHVSRLFFNEWAGLVGPRNAADTDIKTQSVQIVTAFLREAAKRHLTDAGFYNAAKHGFALQPQGRQVAFVAGGDDDPVSEEGARGKFAAGDVEIEWKGPSVSYLVEKEHGNNSERLYVEVTQWMEYADQVANAVMLIEMIHNLWGIARATYTSVTQCTINTWSRPTPRDLGNMRQNTLCRKEVPLAVRKLSSAAQTISLTIYGEPPEAETQDD